MLHPFVATRLAFVPMSFDKSSLAALYSNEGPRLERYLVKRWRLSAAAAADVVQDAFIRLMRVPQQQDIRDVRRYLRRTIETAAIDNRRRQLRQDKVIDPHAEITDAMTDRAPSPVALLISREERHALEAAIAELPPRCREVLLLHKFEELTYAEIAERLGISKNTVMVHLANAMRCLRRSMRDDGGRPAN